MKKAFLLGSSYSAAPFLMELRRRDIEVHVCGKFQDDPCHEYADKSHFVDYSDPAPLLELVEREACDYVVPSCNDAAYLSGAAIAEAFDFPGFDSVATSQLLHTKKAFREFTQDNDVPAPAWATSEGELPDIPLPCLVKPVDTFSGRGMSRVDHVDQLPSALEAARKASRSGVAIVEEFVEGSLHSHSAFVKGGAIAIDFFVDEFCSVYPYQVDCSNHPSFLEGDVRESVRHIVSQLAATLELTDGLLHTQFITRDSQVWIIECMRRAPGDLYPHLISRSTGIAYTELYIQPFIGEALGVENSNSERLIARHTVSTAHATSLFSCSHSIPSNAVTTVPLKSSGHTLAPAPFDKAAILFAEFSSRAELQALTPRLGEFVKITSLEEQSLA